MRLARRLACLASLLCATQATAKSIAELPDHAHALKIHATVQPHAEAPFGEHINLYTGSVSFRHEDVSLAGTGPTLRLVRETTTLPADGLPPPAFGDWQLSVPRIETFVDASLDGRSGAPGERWLVAAPGHPDAYKRCSRVDESYAPPLLTQPWWFGIELFTDTGDRQQVLRRSPQNIAKPTLTLPGATSDFPIVTSAHWQVTCLAKTRNDEAGEAFLALSPDGTRYWFDHLVSEPATTLIETDEGRIIRQRRSLAKMFVSRIEDRFGNALHYEYDGDRLVAITATDGRAVRIDWRGEARLVQAIVVQPAHAQAKTWRYDYRTYHANTGAAFQVLDRVTRPDGAQWKFDLQAPTHVFDDPAKRHCGVRGGLPADPRRTTQTVTTPEGLVGRFIHAPTWHAHSYVQGSCVTHLPGTNPFEETSPLYTTASLVRKELSGAGLSTLAWTYAWSPAEGSVTYDPCALAGTCSETKWVDVVDPAGHRLRYVHANREGARDGQLLRVERHDGQAIVLQVERFEYAAHDAGPWPSQTGSAMTPVAQRSVVETPRVAKTIERQGVTFSERVEAFDAFARPVRSRRWSSLGYTRTDAVAFADNTVHWVLGQVASSTNLDTGLVEARTTHDAVTALPLATYAFGKLQHTRTWHADGTLASASDGRDAAGFDTTVVYSDWKRGVPQRIRYPDATVSAAVVDDFGRIASVTNEVGARTCYAYDAMGRLSQVTYPSETQPGVCDTSAWAPTTIQFSGGHPAVYGMPAGHWRQTTHTGNGRKVLVFDALLRPVVEQHLDLGDVAGTMTEIVRRHDAEGREVFASHPMNTGGAARHDDPHLKGTRTVYDGLGRPVHSEQDAEFPAPLRTLYEYLPAFASRVTPPGGHSTTTHYQVLDQPTTEQVRAIAHPEGAITDIPRDVFGKPQYITRRVADWSTALTRWYAYNTAQELCRITEPESGVTLMGYDAAGNLSWSAAGLPAGTPCDDASATTLERRSTRSYDNRNRLAVLAFADDRGEQTWRHTPDGLPAEVWTYNGPGLGEPVHNGYTYNARRLLKGETLHQPGYTWSLGYEYDRNGFLTVQRYPDTSSYHFTVDARGRTTGITGTSGTYASGARYHPNGALKQFTYGNGIVHALAQNPRGLPDRSIDAHGGVAVLDDSYDYDFNGNVAAISDGLPGGRGNRTMTYDGLDRLRSVTSPMFGGTIAYTYDVLDNIETRVDPTRSLRYCYQSNRLAFIRTGAATCTSGAATATFAFDAQGNVQAKNAQQFEFSQDNRLRAAVGKETYRYDAHGRRASAESATPGSIRSFYNRDGQLSYQNDARQRKNLAHVYLGGSLVATREQPSSGGSPVLKFHHTDALGSPVAVTDANRNVVERSEYEPYGKVLNRPVRDRPGYTGHVEDAQTGLTYMQERYFDPDVGGFLSRDPVTAYGNGDMRFFARYAYAFNNPYRFVDPDGRETASIQKYPMATPDPEAAVAMLGTIADFTPILGDANGIYEALQNPTWTNVAAAGVGLVPIVGDVGGKLIKNADNLASAVPDFVVTPGGTAFPVPQGSTGPVPSINPSGNVTGARYEGGSGGANGQVASMRIMDPNPLNPTGYIKYENNASPKPQGVDPYSGRTVPPKLAHFPIDR